MPDRSEVLAALATVRDPELDEPITELGFVGHVEVGPTTVRVQLRLPTYFCAPNFAWLMVADARDAVERVPGVEHARIELTDHMAADAINAGVARRLRFAQAFPGLADGDVDELRAGFRRRAFVARQQRLCRRLLATGMATPQALPALKVGDLPPGPDTDVYLERRAELGIDSGLDAPLLVGPDGHPVPADQAASTLLRGRVARVSMEGNAALCRGLLATHHGSAGVPAPMPSAGEEAP